ncbi:68fd6bcd-2cf8-44c9-b331-eb9a73437df8 [Sclerotinia trifoliorum]|uniref:68fd6bcd-2cf8-44c9-b331-eb9a73437df8 n=2 Tax=Sclerotinia trifoliorum TaxID=28548 RepID=A0A8H2VU39_9HELO|nr:68fd6bcd-2cf8-44c9-b331-eb9a73437df8 [Sclerotinia trifoliorum]
MEGGNFEFLLQILEDYGIPFDRNTIKSDYSRNPAAVEAWISKYLGPETLLTKDEVALYEVLSQSEDADKIANSQDLSSICDLTDEQLYTAIEELQRSTTAIEQQSEALRLQQNALALLVKSNKKVGAARTEADAKQLQKWEAETSQANSAVEELSQNLMYQLSDLEQQNKISQSSARQTVDGILKADDKLLTSLQKLGEELDPGSSEDHDTIARIRDLCARYIKHTVDGVRTKLDRIYLEALNNPVGTDSQNTNKQEVADLQEELESLYSEVLPVAQMSAEQQYLEPALREIALKGNSGQDRAYQALKYMQECLNFLIKRTEIYAAHMEEYQCHQMATKFAIDTGKKELQYQEAPQPSKSVTRQRQNSQAQVQFRNNRRRSSMFEEMDAESQLLRNLGITLPNDSDADDAQTEFLDSCLRERIEKLKSHAANLESTTETTISSHVHNADYTMKLLYNALQADSVYGEVQLLDPDIVSSFNTFEEEIKNLQENLEAVNLQRLQLKNVHKEQLIKRWSR